MTTKTMSRTFFLTSEESDRMKNQLLSEMDNNDYLNAEYERVKLSHRGVIKQSDELISTLRSNIKSGTKDVDVKVTYNCPEAGKKTVKRSDTGEETIEEMHQAECDEYPPSLFNDSAENGEQPENVYSLKQLNAAPIEAQEIPFEEVNEEPLPAKYEAGDNVKFKLPNGEILSGEIDDVHIFDNQIEYSIYVGSNSEIISYLVFEHEIIPQNEAV